MQTWDYSGLLNFFFQLQMIPPTPYPGRYIFTESPMAVPLLSPATPKMEGLTPTTMALAPFKPPQVWISIVSIFSDIIGSKKSVAGPRGRTYRRYLRVCEMVDEFLAEVKWCQWAKFHFEVKTVDTDLSTYVSIRHESEFKVDASVKKGELLVCIDEHVEKFENLLSNWNERINLIWEKQ